MIEHGVRRRGIVLVHGAMHDARCWSPTVAELRRRAPRLPVLAVDLPGRGANSRPLMDYSVESCVDSIVEQAGAAGLNAMTLVGHSAAGLVLPSVAARLGPDKVRAMVFVAAYVPVQGGCALDLMSPLARRAVRWTTGRKRPVEPIHPVVAKATLCNGMTREQRQFTLRNLCAEYPLLPAITADRSGMPEDVPRWWVMPLRDNALSTKRQHQCIANLGGVTEIVAIDTCHDVMVSEPARLAETLLTISGD